MFSWFSKTPKDSVCFWRLLKPPGFEGSDEKGPGLKTIQHSLLEVLRVTHVHPMGAIGPEAPLSPVLGGTPQAPHWTSRGLVGGQQTSSGT